MPMASDQKLWAAIDAQGNYVRGYITTGAHPSKCGEEIPEDHLVVEVTRFPAPHESWDAETRTFIEDAAKLEAQEAQLAASRLEQCSRTELHTMIMQEVQTLVQSALQKAGLALSAEQNAELFPLLGDGSGIET
jgi:hypothetical protein